MNISVKTNGCKINASDETIARVIHNNNLAVTEVSNIKKQRRMTYKEYISLTKSIIKGQ